MCMDRQWGLLDGLQAHPGDAGVHDLAHFRVAQPRLGLPLELGVRHLRACMCARSAQALLCCSGCAGLMSKSEAEPTDACKVRDASQVLLCSTAAPLVSRSTAEETDAQRGGGTLTAMMQVRPSRIWSPARLGSPSFSALLLRPSVFSVRVSAACARSGVPLSTHHACLSRQHQQSAFTPPCGLCVFGRSPALLPLQGSPCGAMWVSQKSPL